MDNRPVGIFDSGLGGLTAMKALRELLPEENIIYFGDTGRLPYGAKTREQLLRMAVQDLDFVSGFGVKAVIVACGTLSSNAAEILDGWPVPAFGVLRAGVAGMQKIPGEGMLGVIATEASIRSGSFPRALHAACPGREIAAVPCPDFVPLIEAGFGPHTPEVREAVARYLAPLRGADAVLLGCTHSGIIAEAISEYLGPETALVSAAVCGAAQAAQHLIVNGLTGGEGRERFFASGDPAAFTRAASTFLGRAMDGEAEQAPLMEC